MQTLHSDTAVVVARLKPLGRLDAGKRLHLAISLPLRDAAGLSAFLEEVYRPASPNYRRFLSPGEFADRFSPKSGDYESLMAFARAHNLVVTGTHGNRTIVDVEGAVADIEKTFHIRMQVYQHPTEARQFYAPDREPSVDAPVTVLRVSGLDNFEMPRPNLKVKPRGLKGGAAPDLGSGPGGTYAGNDFRAAYVPGSALMGNGQTVGLVEFDGYTTDDIAYYEQVNGLPNVPLTNVLIDGFGGSPSGDGGEVEVSLDIEMAISMAPGLSNVLVYEAPGGEWHDMLNRIATDNQAKQISCSWYLPGGPADPVADQIFQQMAAQGQSFFAASGDYCAYTGLIPFPGDSPYITLVGGTTLTTSGPGGEWVSETVWNWGDGVGSSGGVSTQYAIPSWQKALSMTLCQGSSTMRNSPDVAMTADNVDVRVDGFDEDIGGTSCAAPLWAAFTALVNEQATTKGEPVGFINPAVYAIAQQPKYGSVFQDIITGDNFSSSSPSEFPAVLGYDLCTGLGTPAGQPLIAALAGTPDPLEVSYTFLGASGPAGGAVQPGGATYTLTNIGTAPVTWSASTTQTWLTLSATGGTLAVGGSTAVIASVNATVKSLPAGSYTGPINFGDVTTGATQARPVFLNLLPQYPVMSITPSTGFTMGGPPGGAFNPGTVTYTISNAGATPMSWAVSNTAAWLSVSPGGGTLATGGSATVTASVTAAAGSLPMGSYGDNVTFTNLTNGIGNVSTPATLLVWPPPPAVISGTAINVDQGHAVNYSIIATNSPSSYWAMGLPPGLSLDPDTGVISGTATAAGTADATIEAINLGGTGSETLAINVIPEEPVIDSPLSVTGTFSLPFSYQIFATNGPGSYNSTPLPPGLTLNKSTGIISGTPSALGSSTFTIFAGNNVGLGNAQMTINIVQVTPPVLSNPVMTMATFTGSNGATPTSSLVQGTDGNLYGTTAAGGTVGVGTVFRLTLSGTLTTLASFDETNGYGPEGPLVQATDGNFYGTTEYGGIDFEGSVYRVMTSGSLANLTTFDFTDGAYPFGAVTQAKDGNLYGTTSEGGTDGEGSVYKMSLSGSLSLLFSFDYDDGYYATAGMIQATDNNLYGTTEYGGNNGDGTVFRVSTGGVEAAIYSFGATGTDGEDPTGAVVEGTDGYLYGTTYSGGVDNVGTVYRMSLGGSEKVLCSFTGTNGANPEAGLVQGSDGNFYGTTYSGGPYNDGTVFKITSSGSLTTIAVFDGQNGANPVGGVIQASDGYFYGTTAGAGAGGNGTVFKVGSFAATGIVGTPFNYQITAYNYPATYSAANLPPGLTYSPSTGMISGTPTAAVTKTVTLNAINAGGAVATNIVITVVMPAQPQITSALEATVPQGQLFTYQVEANVSPATLAASGLPPGLTYNAATAVISGIPTVAGTTGIGLSASNPAGTGSSTLLLTVLPEAPVITTSPWTLCSFSGPSGSGPATGVIQASDGNLYGTTQLNIGTGDDTVFQVSTSGTVAAILTAPDGSCPRGQLVQANDGNLYGTAEYGGTNGYGSLFQLGLSGSVSQIFSFNNTNGAEPMGGLTQGNDGNLYGTTFTGGAGGAGTVYRMTLSGSQTMLCSFSGTNGSGPMAVVIQGSDGNYYGTTSSGGSRNDGTVFQLTGSGSLTTLVSFTGTNGWSPMAGLVEGTDGNYYGTTYYGGSQNAGTVFQVTSSGSLATLASFNNADGANPMGGVIEGGDGNYYGTTSAGGTSNLGTIFEITPGGTLTTLYSFTGAGDGAGPDAGLTQGSDGNLYGTTSTSGSDGGGTVFGMTPLYVTGTTGQPLSYQINATNSPTSYNAAVLPAGLNVNNSTGLISGTSAPGVSAVTISAANGSGTGSATLVINMLPLPPQISGLLSVTAIEGEPFQYSIMASNSPASYGASGLPAGLNVNAVSGVISGTATMTGSSDVIISATNAGGFSTAALSIIVLPPPPSANTGIAGGVVYDGAILNGTLNPNGLDALGYFEIGVTTAYGTATPGQDMGSGTNGVAIAATVTGLLPNMTYHYRLDGTNSSGLTTGSDEILMTPPPPPTATTGTANPVVYNAATLGGTVTPNGLATTAYFAYGTTGSYGAVTNSQSLGNGTGGVALSGTLAGLSPNTVYHFQVVAINSSGTSAGEDASFTTPPPPPVVATAPASGITYSTAILNGTVNPNGLDSPSYFQWGTTAAYGNTAPVQDPGSGTSAAPVSASLTGLNPDTTYYFQLVSVNSSGTSYGINQTFTTAFPPPTVTTGTASGVVYNGATLNASVNPNTLGTVVYFEYGTTQGYGSATAVQYAGSGAATVTASVATGALTPNTLYHYEAVAVNSSGTSTGGDATFTTPNPPPTAITNPATGITYSSAGLNGTVNPNGLDSSAYFQWGTTTAYGNATGTQDMGSGSTAAPVSAALTGLAPNTTYDYQLVAINTSGTFYGNNLTFTTPAPAPSVTTGTANPVSYQNATIGGTVNPNGLATTAYFAYGTTNAYGAITPSQALGSGSAAIALSGSLAGLTPNTVYHYHLVALNSSGTTPGMDEIFTTAAPPPAATTGTATNVTYDGATLGGTVNPNGLDTAVYFEYGTTGTYGSVTNAQDIGNGTDSLAVLSQVTGLAALDGYHFRIVAANSSGTVDGTDQTFFTSNGQPVAVNDDVYTAGLNGIKIDVLENDTDPDGDPLTVISVTQGAQGGVVINPDSTVTYIPGPGFKTADQFNYTISDGHGSNATATVFVHNGFISGQGTYSGLITGTVPLNGNSGMLTASVTAAGGYTGKLLFGGLSYPLSGKFDANMSSSRLIARTNQEPLAVTLQLDPINGQIAGLLTTGPSNSQLIAMESTYTAKTHPAPQQGTYTALLKPGIVLSGTGVPQGNGFLSINVTAGGAVTATGKLGDGTSITASGVIVSGSDCPFYARAYGAAYPYAGSAFGTIVFETVSASKTCSGTFDWFKPAQKTKQAYQSGFALTGTVQGSGSAAPAGQHGALVFPGAAGTTVRGGGE